MSQHPARRRQYRSDLRQQQAAQTRRQLVQAAIDVFGENGYQATTFSLLAERAGVSAETVQRNGPKSALLWAAVELASLGTEGETDFFNTDIGQAMLQIDNKDQLAPFSGAATLAVNETSAPVWTAFTEAANSDPELKTLLDGRLADIRTQTEHILRTVADRGWLRTDVPFDELVEAHCVLTSIETYVRFVLHDDKTPDQYTAFIERTIRETILAT